MIAEQLTEIYEKLYERFGPQHWWPGDSQFEIITGAILTQNTSWANVEKAINNLKAANCLDAESLHRMPIEQLAGLIRPAGYFNIKAKRFKNFLNWLFDNYAGDLSQLQSLDTAAFRQALLAINGIGRETADSILLYAFNRPVFVVDAYTARVAVRHHLADPEADYEQLQEIFQSNLPEDVQLFNEYHALLVRVGKEFCRPKALCPNCPLESLPHTADAEFF